MSTPSPSPSDTQKMVMLPGAAAARASEAGAWGPPILLDPAAIPESDTVAGRGASSMKLRGTCRVARCGLRTEVTARYCHGHNRLWRDGLLLVDEDHRHCCVRRGCKADARGSAFCEEHLHLWQGGLLRLRRRNADKPFEAVRIWPVRQLVGVGLMTLALGTLVWSVVRMGGAAYLGGRGGRTAVAEAPSTAPWAKIADPSISYVPPAPKPPVAEDVGRALTGVKSKDAFERRRCMKVLRWVPTWEAMRALVGGLADSDSQVRDEARRSLARQRLSGFVHDAPAMVIDDLSDAKTRQARVALAASLGSVAGPAAYEPLVQLIDKDPDDAVRLAAVTGLARVRSGPSVLKLKSLLDSTDAAFRAEACTGLGHAGNFGAIEWLIPMLEDKELKVAGNALSALKKLSGQALAPSPELWWQWWYGGVSTLYGRIDEAIADLDKAQGEARRERLMQLASVRHELVLRTCVRELENPDERMRSVAARALGVLAMRDGVHPLTIALADPDEEVAAFAHESLRRVTGLGDGPAVGEPYIEWYWETYD